MIGGRANARADGHPTNGASAPEVAAGSGADVFARFAYAPNDLGYCGPPDAAALREGTVAQVRAAARRFSGAWPYLRVMARMTGITDPLDHRLVESYWLGGGLGADLDHESFAHELLAMLGPAAGHYWKHLTPDLGREAAPNHCFHVFGVYPWSRLLGVGTGEHPLRILDDCRITWAVVRARRGDEITVECRRLLLDGSRLRLSAPETRSVTAVSSARRLATEADVGDRVALHWGRVCGRIDENLTRVLAEATEHQLRVTNARLAAAGGPDPACSVHR
ncbi:DUF6390 family protein [Nocardia sp. NBC_01377]|uniref:DUF6390 family protein n=1 Tax=Nocardia sp. NBC_01377 TaxID=2903595 RepID=UPI0032556EFB